MSQELTKVILDALMQLDAKNDNHWTATGEPRIDTVRMLASNSTLTRDMVTAAAPDFTRAAYTAYREEEAKRGAAPQGPANGDQAAQPAPAPQPPEQPSTAASEPAPVAAPNAGGGENAQEAEPTQVGGGEPSWEDEIAALEEALASARQETERLRRIKDAAVKEFETAQRAEDVILVKLAKVGTRDTEAVAIQQYLKAQHARMQRRGDVAAAIREAGIRMRDLHTASPIDAAMRGRPRAG